MRVTLESPNQPEAIALIGELDAYQDALYPPEARYALDLTSLCQPNVRFAIARSEGGGAVGCGAVVKTGSLGEIKRMYVQAEQRGGATASLILQLLEGAAARAGCTELKLETGPFQPEALRFYAKHGYVRCGAFGEYPEHPLSVFMVKMLASK